MFVKVEINPQSTDNSDRINQCISLNYNDWKQKALAISGKRHHEELLHHIIYQLFDRKYIHSQDFDNINNYVVKSMSMAYRHKSSSYWREHEIRNSTEITETMEMAEPDQSSRIHNENIDILISRLSPIESEIFRLYILPGFSYDALSKETGVPVKYLYSRVQTALNKIKRNVYIR